MIFLFTNRNFFSTMFSREAKNMSNKSENKSKIFLKGMRDGAPIGLGYFAVSFSIGITAKNVGLTALQGFFLSLLNNASAGEVAGLSSIAAQTSLITLAVVMLITNARYLLMSCALSQKFSPDTPFYHRLLIAFDITDEVFGIGISYPGFLEPAYMYGAFLTTIPMWAAGTVLGIVVGNILPQIVVNALSVAIYGMFLAVVIPPCRKNKVITGVVICSFVLSYISKYLPILSKASESIRVIILTVLISGIAAVLFPVKDDKEEGRANE